MLKLLAITVHLEPDADARWSCWLVFIVLIEILWSPEG